MAVQLSDLVDLPASPADRCRLAERFLDEWLPDLVRTDSAAPVGLPHALAWAYAHFGVTGARLFVQDPLLPQDRVGSCTEDVVPFRREQQGVVEWGFRAGGGDDPDVLVRPGDGSAPWEPYQDSLSMHVVEAVLTETSLMGKYVAHTPATDDNLSPLQELQLLGIPRHRFWGGAGWVEWRGLDGVVVRNDADTWLWAVARSPAELDALLESVPGDWSVADD